MNPAVGRQDSPALHLDRERQCSSQRVSRIGDAVESCASSAAEDDWAELLTLMEENELEESTSREKKAGTNAVRWSWLHALVMSVALLGLCILMGVVMGNMRSSGRGRAEARLALWPEPLWSNPCAGSIQVSGLGTVPLINAKYNLPSDPAGNVWMEDAAVVIADKGRTYWGTSCNTSGHQKNFHPSGYIELHLLGKRLEYTTDINGVQCGCNAALYLVSMSRSPWQSTCEDYYCDAMSICGVQCHEIDLQEANLRSIENMRAFHSTFHDLESVWSFQAPSLGTGGGGDTFTGPRDFGSTQYGEGSSCIDTREKFRVSVEFPVHDACLQDPDNRSQNRSSWQPNGDLPLRLLHTRATPPCCAPVPYDAMHHREGECGA
eukprot:s3183_g8.t1